jgi:hypothetical protein
VDHVLNRFSTRSKALQAVLAGSGFLVLSVLANWPFASFLVTPAARNWVFGMNYFGYNIPPSEYHLAWEFQAYEKTRPEFWTGMATALVVTALSVRIGMLWGDWMRRMHR